MAVLTINQAYNPSSFAATAASGGSLADTTYYYRLAAVNSTGELMSCGEAHATTSGSDNTVDLTWDAMTGLTYFYLYRTTNAVADDNDNAIWYTGSLLIKNNISASAVSYSDAGDSAGAGYCVRYVSDESTTALRLSPVTEPATVPEQILPGRQGSIVQSLGYPTREFEVNGITVGANAITHLGYFRVIRSHGVAIKIIYSVASQTWINGEYFYQRNLLWTLRPGTDNTSGGEIFNWSLDFKRFLP